MVAFHFALQDFAFFIKSKCYYCYLFILLHWHNGDSDISIVVDHADVVVGNKFKITT